MDTKLLLSCLFSYVFSLLWELGEGKWPAEKCSSAGFSSNLLCNSCDDLNKFNLTVLETSCRECCGDVMEDTAFVKGEQKDMFRNLRIQYERGADPQLMLHDESDAVKESLAIDKWDTDTVTAFLKEKLRQ